jgi:hypothetical protein
MGGYNRVPGPVDLHRHEAASSVRLRFPTLEIFAATHGAALAIDGRKLTCCEIERARELFDNSLNYDEVRIVVALLASSPLTLGSQIRISPRIAAEGLPSWLLMHELTHVWQYQTRGTRYISNSICHHLAAWTMTGAQAAAYELSGTEIVKAGSIHRLSAEQQAMLVQAWFLDSELRFPLTRGQLVSQRVRENAASQHMLQELRSARPTPLSFRLEEAAWGADTRAAGFIGTERPATPLVRFEVEF